MFSILKDIFLIIYARLKMTA